MAIAGRLKASVLARLDELIQEGEQIPLTSHSRVTGGNYLSGEVYRQGYQLVSLQEFVSWRTSCAAVLEQVVPASSTLHATVVGFIELDNKPSTRDRAIGFLRAVRRELDAGSLDSFAMKIEADVLSDYLDQAHTLLGDQSDGFTHIAAAVVAGAALERCLRAVCTGLAPPEPVADAKGNLLTLTPLVEALKRRQVYNELQAKELRTWAALRNHAAHGDFDQFTREQAASMVDGVGRFVSAYAV
jgi:hypothetical protein